MVRCVGSDMVAGASNQASDRAPSANQAKTRLGSTAPNGTCQQSTPTLNEYQLQYGKGSLPHAWNLQGVATSKVPSPLRRAITCPLGLCSIKGVSSRAIRLLLTVIQK